MSLMSLLIALLAQRHLSSRAWQFSFYYQHYVDFLGRTKIISDKQPPLFADIVALAIPVVLCSLLLSLVNDGILYFILSTLILVVSFGCISTRETYKKYLMSAFKGEETSCTMHHCQLSQDKNVHGLGFGQLLVWLNYRYYIAIMLFFVIFGAPGALFYRLLCTINEQHYSRKNESNADKENDDEEIEEPEDEQEYKATNAMLYSAKQIQFWVDWLPVRVVAFGYMLVGHFSKAVHTWLEDLFDFGKTPQQILTGVAQKSEDLMVDKDDCTAEPCLLVRLAKRTLLLFLAIIAVLILTGVIS